MTNVIGKDVTVYCRYLFAVPVQGCITDVSNHDGAYEVFFYTNNPGGPNVTKHNGKFFLPEQCKVNESQTRGPRLRLATTKELFAELSARIN